MTLWTAVSARSPLRSRDLPLPLHRIFSSPAPDQPIFGPAPLHFPLPLRSHALYPNSRTFVELIDIFVWLWYFRLQYVCAYSNQIKSNQIYLTTQKSKINILNTIPTIKYFSWNIAFISPLWCELVLVVVVALADCSRPKPDIRYILNLLVVCTLQVPRQLAHEWWR